MKNLEIEPSLLGKGSSQRASLFLYIKIDSRIIVVFPDNHMTFRGTA